MAFDRDLNSSRWSLPSTDAQYTALFAASEGSWWIAEYRKCFPSGRKNGQRCDVCKFGSIFVTSAEFPPLAFTRRIGDCALAEYRITPPGPQVPPRPRG